MKFLCLIISLICFVTFADTELTKFEKSCGFVRVEGDKVYKDDGSYSYRADFVAPPCMNGKCTVGCYESIKFEDINYKNPVAEIIQDSKITPREKELGVVRVDETYAYFANGSYSYRKAFNETQQDMFVDCPRCRKNLENVFVNPLGTLKITP